MTRNSKESATGSKVKTTPIAIIGIGSIFPQARSTQEYWDNILRKIDTITDIPASRWSIEDYYDPNPAAPDKSYCKRGGFIPDIDFDPMEFGLPPNILEVTDVSQLLSLVVARDALDNAGYGEDRPFDREHTGCILGFVGTSSKLFTPLMTRLQYPVWEKVLRSAGVSESDTRKIIDKIKLAYVGWEENSFPGAIGNVVSGRVCNRFDLGGTNCVVDAACASSLAAVRMAVAELIEGRANMMITGGVDTDNSINSYMCFSKTPAFTKKDNVRSFDAESGGMMVGEGLGMIVLKRLEDAERDGDRIYAVIKAIGTSSDGRFKSIYAPRPSGQAVAVRRAYEEAGFSPETVGLIEAHGTGTGAGDPAEFQGLLESFGVVDTRKQHIALGSVKSQIAHTKAAAGVASLIKTSLALYHKILPPTINVTKPNPKFNIQETPFYINTETRPWMRAKSQPPRRAGVSSFGFGGTNFHVALEEHEAEQTGAYRLSTVAQPVLLSAPDAVQLAALGRETLVKLQGERSALNFAALSEASRNLVVPSAHARLGFVAETAEEARQLLQTALDTLAAKPQETSWELPKGIYYRQSALETRGKVVALFSGQGSQYLEMGRELALNFPTVREVFSNLDELFIKDGLEPLSARVYPRPVFEQAERDALSEALTRTEHAQPAIGSISVALYKLLQQAGFQPDFTAGHSFGELTALWAAGVLDDTDYYALAKARGKAMAPPDEAGFDAGTMVAVKGEAEKVRAALAGDSEVTLANWNSNDQVVIAGSKPAMTRAQQALTAQGFKCIPLTVSAAFHTPLVKHAQKPFAKAIQVAKFHTPKVKVYSNGTAQPHAADPEAIRTRLAEHILNPVLFRDEIQNIYAAGGTIFVEFGPKNVLTNLVDNILAGKPHLAVALNANAKKDSDRQLREAVMALRVAGLPLQNFDPFAAPARMAEPRKKSPVTVKLNGGYYVSEKTRSAFEKALNDGFRVTSAVAAPAVSAAPAPASMTPAMTAPAAPAASAVPTPVSPEKTLMSSVPSLPVEQILSEYQSHQSETLRLHEQYLRTEEEYARAFAQLTQLQSDLVRQGAQNGLQALLPLFESLERSMLRFHEHQAETLRVHQNYLETQERFSQSFVQNIQVAAGSQPAAAAYSVPAAMPAPVYTPAPAAQTPFIQAPVAPAAPAPRPQPVTVVSTPFNGSGNGNGNGNGAKVAPAAAPAVPALAPAIAPVGLPDVSQLTAALLSIVSEKTGYPVETLELDMDMEADLGIDSIKRVEILGAMQTQFPELPKIDTNVLAELRTLGQIVSQFSAPAPAVAVVTPVTSVVPVQSTVVQAPAVQAGSPAIDASALTQALLAIVSEKTGYPAETLELDMDMEADLGIDSIKRVEILGAMQTQFPELPKVESSALAELRTLGQIVEAMSANVAAAIVVPAPVVGTVTAPVVTAAAAPGLPGVEAVTRALLEVVSEKTGYPVETLELDMDMEADLGIDSIKRVEILGAMQTQFPELPKVDASVLAELRTLGQIINQLSSGAAAVAPVTPSETPVSVPSTGVAASSPFEPAPENGAATSSAANATTAATAFVADIVNTVEPEPALPGVQQGVVTRKILPPPDALDFVLPAGHTCLITDDGTPAVPALVEALLAKSWPVTVLRLPIEVIPQRMPLPQGARVADLPDLSEPALQAMLTQIGPVAVFIHMESCADTNLDNGVVNFSEAEKSLLKLVFLAAKHLKPALNQAAQQGRAVFMTVTHLDGQFGLSGERDFTPVSGGLFGLVKTLNLEWEPVFCRAVDLSPALETGRVVSCILAELHDPNRLVAEVGYTSEERSTLVVTEVPVTGGKK